ncbi:hypothetical protein KOR34_41210 [Posidoniimonas corsicana]|uniref:Uncharacterized protein n=2 Tax=Posidoniimonas corsicana TaxID=1938618 RepID=A0A5C5V1L0_9BACT|nr:hypothetical protein KOR34_41210 [Posidoniimonas corsicana]
MPTAGATIILGSGTCKADANGEVQILRNGEEPFAYFVTLPDGATYVGEVRGHGSYEVYFSDKGVRTVTSTNHGIFRVKSETTSVKTPAELLRQLESGEISEREFFRQHPRPIPNEQR